MAKKDVSAKALALHKKLKGKIRITPTVPVRNRVDLSLVYTPGVGAVSSFVAKHKTKAREYTMKSKMIAVVSDGSAVLGLGNIGALGALPVMEGKAALFKTFADVDAFPIVLDTQDTAEIIETVVRIAPGFGGINLEDFAAPKCFEIEEALKARLDIPVMHDDQHGTAIAVLAGLINAMKVTKRRFEHVRIVVNGVGAAGVATIRLIKQFAPKAHIIAVDSVGVVWKGRSDLTPMKKKLIAERYIAAEKGGTLEDALVGADVFLGVSKPGVLKPAMVRTMAKDCIIFAMANPIPEIFPDEARKAGAGVVATGRSDFPNQINNSLVFPGVFRGALDNNVKKITDRMKMKAAQSLAALVKKPTRERIIPGPFEKGVSRAVAKAIR